MVGLSYWKMVCLSRLEEQRHFPATNQLKNPESSHRAEEKESERRRTDRVGGGWGDRKEWVGLVECGMRVVGGGVVWR
jgi:hypothetical protein